MGDVASLVFDPNDPSYIEDPYPTYRRLREEAPVYYWDATKAWVLSRYDDCLSLLRDRRFSLSHGDWELTPPRPIDAAPTRYETLMASMLFVVPEQDHLRIRKLASPAFTPRAVEAMRPQIEAIVAETLARMTSSDVIDIANEFSEQIPLRVIGHILDIPAQFEATFRDFGGAVVESVNPWLGPDDLARIHALIPPGIDLLEQLVAERRKRPGDDLLSKLIHYEEEGDRLTTAELLSLVGAIVIAGAETTTHLLSFAVWNLLRHPDQLALLRADPSLVRGTVEEVLRFDSFGKVGSPRYARDAMSLCGVEVRRGQMVLALGPAALRDPDVFPEPDVFDIRRDNSRSLTFGSGAHYCLGASLARLEGEVALDALFRAFPDMRLAGVPSYAQHASMRKMAALPVRLHP